VIQKSRLSSFPVFAATHMRCSLWLAVLLVSASCACSSPTEGSPTAAGARPARQVIVAVDLSGSRTLAALKSTRDLLETIVDGLGGGDEIVLLRIPETDGQHDVSSWVKRFSTVVDPLHLTKHEERQLLATKQDVAADVNALINAPPLKGGGTDIVAALFAAGDKAKEAEGRRTTLVLLSDMIQEGRSLNFQRVVPGKAWIEEQHKSGLIPALAGVCVTAVGPDTSTRVAVSTRQFWASYFEAAGASFSPDRYRRTMYEFQSVLCS
jgi:hypothetical protein